jgi:hypothetical protein
MSTDDLPQKNARGAENFDDNRENFESAKYAKTCPHLDLLRKERKRIDALRI